MSKISIIGLDDAEKQALRVAAAKAGYRGVNAYLLSVIREKLAKEAKR